MRNLERSNNRTTLKTKKTFRPLTSIHQPRFLEEASLLCPKKSWKLLTNLMTQWRLPRNSAPRVCWAPAIKTWFKLRARSWPRSRLSRKFWKSTQMLLITDNLFAEKYWVPLFYSAMLVRRIRLLLWTFHKKKVTHVTLFLDNTTVMSCHSRTKMAPW